VAAGETTKYWFSTLSEGVAFDRLIDLTKLRWQIERDYRLFWILGGWISHAEAVDSPDGQGLRQRQGRPTDLGGQLSLRAVPL
jgi:hypothetical protein